MKRIFLLIILTFFLAGCTNIYNVRVNSYLDSTQAGSPIPQGASFFVIADKFGENPILEKQIQSRIESLLRSKGYRIEAYDKADFFVEFTYEAPTEKTQAGIRPVYHEPRTETVRTYTSSGKSGFSYIKRPGYTSYVPYSYNAYTSTFTLNIIDANVLGSPKENQMVWKSESSITAKKLGLREAINYLLIGTFKFFGQDTRIGVSADISENDPQLKRLLIGE